MTEIIFIIITFLAMLFFWLGSMRNRAVLLISLVWLFISGIIAATGFLKKTDILPPGFIWIIIGAIVLVVLLYRSVSKKSFRYEFALAVHALRLPVEIVLYRLFLEKKVPVLMTFAGWNFDILMGLTALAILSYSLITGKKLPHVLLRLWNIAGLIFISIIVSIGILSSPLPFQQLAFDQPNFAVLFFPYTWLPAYVVPIVIVTHLLLLRKQEKS